jgi:hypothetical protein
MPPWLTRLQLEENSLPLPSRLPARSWPFEWKWKADKAAPRSWEQYVQDTLQDLIKLGREIQSAAKVAADTQRGAGSSATVGGYLHVGEGRGMGELVTEARTESSGECGLHAVPSLTALGGASCCAGCPSW